MNRAAMFDRLMPFFLLAASMSFALGITMPLVRLDRFFLFAETPSLLEIVTGLWQQEETVLAAIVAIFSIAFPVVKLASLFQAAIGNAKFPSWLGVLSKWSMMDVLLVAIVVFSAKTSGLATAISQPGLWFYTASAILTAVTALALQDPRARHHQA